MVSPEPGVACGVPRTPESNPKIESPRTANVDDPQDVVEECPDYVLHVESVRSELAHIRDGEYRQGRRGVVPTDRGLQ